MFISLSETFQKNLQAYPVETRHLIFDAILKIPSAAKNPLAHTGLGLRKIHASGIFEARIGLNLRIVFHYEKNGVFLQMLGSHNDIKRFLKLI